MNQVINMVLRRVMRQLFNRGVKAGLNVVSGGGANPAPQGKNQAPKQDLKRAKQAMRVMRRASKF